MEKDNLIEKQLSSQLIYDGCVVHLYRDEIELPNGHKSMREYVRHFGAVCVVPLTSEGDIIFVRQFRYAFGKTLLEIPAGKLDSPDEDPNSAVLRELREETGATCGKLTFLGKLYPSVGISDEVVYMYAAEELEYGSDDPDEDEFLEVVRIPFDKAVDMIMSGEICDSKTQTAILKFRFLKDNEK